MSNSSTSLGLMDPPETSNAKNACLALQSQAYRFLRDAIMLHCNRRTACQNKKRSKKVISLKTISEKLTAWRRYRAAMRELSQLSDHDLSDIGIGRGDIEYVARRPVVGKASA
jgi:uncharacterized protein YjiS (DUF1127 family)